MAQGWWPQKKHLVPAKVPEHWDPHLLSQEKAGFLARIPSLKTAPLSEWILEELQPASSALTKSVLDEDSEAWLQSAESPGQMGLEELV